MRFQNGKCKAGPLRTAATACAALLLFSTAALAQTQDNGPPQQVIVKWKSGLSPALRGASAAQSMDRAGARIGVSVRRLRGIVTGGEVVSANRRLSRAEFDDLINSFKNDPNVEYAEEDLMLRRAFVPNDSRYAEQWSYFETTGGINLPPAWDIVNGSGVTVAVLDTGYRPHADLAANIVGGYDFISSSAEARDGNGRDNNPIDQGDWYNSGDCGDSSSGDSSWHGTHVAGTVAAVTNNSSGVAGVAYGARVLPVRVLGRCGGATSDIADAIVWAAGGTVSGIPANPNPARVINMSLGSLPGAACASTTQTAINTARSLGAVVVVSAGNSNANAGTVTPARCAGVIAVASVGRNGGKAWYSNFGAVVDVAAPGGSLNDRVNFIPDQDDILSTLNTGLTTPVADALAFYAGTSMAAPHVTGVVALMLSRNSALTPDDLEARLKSSTRAFPATCSQCGTGIINALAAVNAATGDVPNPGACPAGYTTFTGSLSSVRSSVYAPSSSGAAAAAGVLSGRLTGPTSSSVDLDLYLQRRNSSGTWTQVAASESASSVEAIDFNGTAATYRWRVYSFAGTGAFTLCTRTP
jgi:serine protease